jgi:hypothetical protein
MAIADHLDLADLATRYARDRADQFVSDGASAEWEEEYAHGRQEFFAALRNILTAKIDTVPHAETRTEKIVDHILAVPNDDTSAEALAEFDIKPVEKYHTLGDIEKGLAAMKADGMTLESIEYVLKRAYWEDFDKRAADQATIAKLAAPVSETEHEWAVAYQTFNPGPFDRFMPQTHLGHLYTEQTAREDADRWNKEIGREMYRVAKRPKNVPWQVEG